MNLQIEPLSKTIEDQLRYDPVRVEVTCPVCHNHNWEQMDAIRRPMQNSHLCLCRDCGFITWNPQLKNLQDFYRREAKQQTINFMITKSNKLERHNKLIFKYLEESKFSPKRVLDFGASDGYLLKEFKRRIPEVECVGIELNPGHANWAKYIDDLNVTMDPDVTKLEGKFDIIVLYHVLEHLQEPDKFIKQAEEKLTEDGLLYIALPTISRCDYPTIEQLFKDEHINVFTNETLVYFLNKMGFEEVFFDNTLYGTCVIVKKNKEFKELIDKNFYAQNLQLLQRIKVCFDNKNLMDSVMKRGSMVEARVHATTALQAYDEYPELICKACSLNDTIDEVDMLKEYIAKKPHLHELKKQVAMCYYKDKDFEEAEKWFTEYEKYMGVDSAVLSHFAYIRYYQRDLLGAISYVKRAFEHEKYNPDNLMLLGALVMKL